MITNFMKRGNVFMSPMVTITNVWKLETTKNGKTLLKIFDDNRFETTIFVLDPEQISKLGNLVQGYQYTFTYIRSYNSGFGNLLRLTCITEDDDDVTLYTF